MNLSEVKTKTITELVEIAEKLGLENVGRLKKQDIIFQILKKQADDGIDIFGGGCLLYTSPSPRDLDLSRMPSSA